MSEKILKRYQVILEQNQEKHLRKIGNKKGLSLSAALRACIDTFILNDLTMPDRRGADLLSFEARKKMEQGRV